MCDICDKVKGLSFPLKPEETKDLLDQVGARVRERPNAYRHLAPVMDKILGTELKPRNRDAEEVYEAKMGRQTEEVSP